MATKIDRIYDVFVNILLIVTTPLTRLISIPLSAIIYAPFLWLAWNYTLPQIFGIIEITFLQAIALIILANVFIPTQVVPIKVKDVN